VNEALRLEPWPACGKHRFLSHVREDRDWLAIPLAKELEQRRLIAWVDFIDGRNQEWSRPLSVLRHGVNGCRHVVYLLTEAALKQGRGWLAAERAYAEQMQQLLCWNETRLFDVELVLRFPRADDLGGVDRLMDESVWHPLLIQSRRIAVSDATGLVVSATDAIEEFVRKQVQRGRDFPPDLLEQFDDNRSEDPEFLDRLTAASLERVR